MKTPTHLHIITVRMTRTERDRLKLEAWKERVSLNTHVRRLCGLPDKPPRPPVSEQETESNDAPVVPSGVTEPTPDVEAGARTS